MAYLKAALIGVLTGTATSILMSIATILVAFRSIASTGSGGLGAVSVGLPFMSLSWLVGFALGFYLMLRRQHGQQL